MRVLIVDDSIVHIRKMTQSLKELGHGVVGHAQTGAEGVRLFKTHKPDLVFLDIVMPEMDGLTALRMIRNLDENASVVMLTSIAGVGGQVEKALQLGAKAVLSKPATEQDIANVLARLGSSEGGS